MQELQRACEASGGRLIAVQLDYRYAGVGSNAGCGKPCRPVLQVTKDSSLMLPLAVDVPCGRVFRSGDFSQEALCDTCREHKAVHRLEAAENASPYMRAWKAACAARDRMLQEADAGSHDWNKRMDRACATAIEWALTAK